jgi:hypothetical protein
VSDRPQRDDEILEQEQRTTTGRADDGSPGVHRGDVRGAGEDDVVPVGIDEDVRDPFEAAEQQDVRRHGAFARPCLVDGADDRRERHLAEVVAAGRSPARGEHPTPLFCEGFEGAAIECRDDPGGVDRDAADGLTEAAEPLCHDRACPAGQDREPGQDREHGGRDARGARGKRRAVDRTSRVPRHRMLPCGRRG